MALTMFLRKSSNLPVLTNVASKLMAAQTVNSSLVCIGAQRFGTLNRPATVDKKLLTNVNAQLVQHRGLNHAQIWAMEKYLSWALLPIIPYALANPSPAMDNIMAVALTIHMHWGMESIVIDYIRPALVGNFVSTLAWVLINVFSAVTLAGLLYFNQNDSGLSKAISSMWEFGTKDECCVLCDEKGNKIEKRKKGIEAIVVDYVRPVVFGEAIPKIARMLVYLISAFTLGGLLYFNMNDVGISQAVRRFWSIKQ